MSGPGSEGPGRRPEDVLLRASAVPSVVVAAAVVAVSAAWGGRAVAGAAVGSVLALAVFASGPLLLRTSSRWSPPAQMAAVMGAYMASVLVLGLAYLLLAGVGWLSTTAVGVAIVVVALAWITAQTRATGRLRILAFGGPPDPSGGHDVAGHDGSTESPGRTSH